MKLLQSKCKSVVDRTEIFQQVSDLVDLIDCILFYRTNPISIMRKCQRFSTKIALETQHAISEKRSQAYAISFRRGTKTRKDAKQQKSTPLGV